MKYSFFTLNKYYTYFFLKELKNLVFTIECKIRKIYVNFLNIKSYNNYKKFLLQSKIFYGNKQKKLNDSSNGVLLVTYAVAHPAYFLGQIIASKNLEKILGLKVVQSMSKNDIICEALGKNSGIDEKWIFDKCDLITRLKYFIRSIKILSSIDKIDDIYNFKINQVKIGEIVIDHYIRFTGIPSVNSLDFKFFYFFSKALEIYEYANKIFEEKNIKGLLISETQFIPSAIMFQTALTKKCKVYVRYGGPKRYGVRVYSDILEVDTAKYSISKDLFEETYKKNYHQVTTEGDKIIKNRFLNIRNFPELSYNTENLNREISFDKKNKKNSSTRLVLNKEEICKKFDWDLEKPIVIIFDHSFLDGLFVNGRVFFKDNISWIRETFKEIKKISKVNWLIKAHPERADLLHKSITSTENEFKKIIGNENHIKIFPNNYSSSSLPEIASAIITGYGTPGIEYPCFGIPCILGNKSHYSGHGFTYEPQSKKEYFDYLYNIDKIEKLSEDQINRAKTFLYMENVLLLNESPLLPYYRFTREFFYKDYENNFWLECTNLLKKYDKNKDIFNIMLEKQIKLNNKKTINFNMLK